MTDLCKNLDPYLAGSLSDVEDARFEQHALACAACNAGLALPTDITAALASLATESCPPAVLAAAQSATDGDWPQAWSGELRALSAMPCPPEVLAAALKRTRRAGDRDAVPARRRRQAVWALAALVAIGVSWATLRTSTHAPAQIAETSTGLVPARDALTSAEPEPEAPMASATSSAPMTPDSAPPVPLVADAQSPQKARQPSRSEDSAPERAPDSAPVASVPNESGVAAAEQPSPDLAESQPTAEEIEDAQRDLALAFALVADAQSAASTQVREQAQALTSTLDRTSIF